MIRLWRSTATACDSGVQRIQNHLLECPRAVCSGVPQRQKCAQKRTQSTAPSRPGAGDVASKLLVANPRLEEKLNYVMKLYEDFIGLTEVKAAQAKVISAESEFKAAQERRALQQRRMMELQHQLREIHAELDKTARGEDRHLQLITKEHAVLREERQLLTEFRETEKREHSSFSLLSFALRESHEKERAQAEKTKYWSIIGSVAGTVIGIVATTINNQYRLHQLRKLVTDATFETAHCRDLILQIREGLNEQNAILKGTTVLSASNSTSEAVRSSIAAAMVDEEGEASEGETHVLVAPIDRVYVQTVHLEDVVRQTSLLNTALISAMFVVVPLVSWMISR